VGGAGASHDVPVTVFPTHICFEIKWLDADEFTNWTGHDFITSERATRKQRDWAVLEPHGQIVTRGAPALKHMHYRGFEKFVQPMLRRTGQPHVLRDSSAR